MLFLYKISKATFKDEALNALVSKFLNGGINTPDQLHLILAIKELVPDFDLKQQFA
jgi:hypothetical protein